MLQDSTLILLLALATVPDKVPARSPASPAPVAPAPSPPSSVVAMCRGEYADSALALAPGAREIEDQPYSYCVRSTATYECLSYGPDGNVRRAQKTAVTHGTAFGYRYLAGGTYLLTNHHVAEWPLVTDEAHPAASVPVGCKRVAEEISIVENESDNYPGDDIELSRVVADLSLDASILRAKTKLKILPWKLGKSSALRERNYVQVRGFPLGVFQATNDGKVISAHDHDTDKDWDHDDFVIDALLSHGSSGSPVLAVSCKTGEFELVGLFHAGYTGGNALNVVVGIDQLKDMMTTLKKKPRPKSEEVMALDLVARARLMQQSTSALSGFFPFGSNVASFMRRFDDALIFSIYPREFPLATHPLIVLEDRPDALDFGRLGRVWFGTDAGLKEYARSDLDADVLGHLEDVLDALRRNALLVGTYRAVFEGPATSREASDRQQRLARAMKRSQKTSASLAESAEELASRFAPRRGVDTLVSAASVLTSSTASLPSPISLKAGERADP